MSVDPLAQLRLDLAAALQAQPEADEEENAPRIPSWAALNAVITHLRRVGIEPKLWAPLGHLLGALDDANGGRSNPITTPRPYVEGRDHKLRDLAAGQLAMAAAAVTLLVRETGVSADQALARAARAIGISKPVLKEFRKNLTRAGNRAPRSAKEQYWEWLEERKRQGKLSADEFVEILLANAAIMRGLNG